MGQSVQLTTSEICSTRSIPGHNLIQELALTSENLVGELDDQQVRDSLGTQCQHSSERNFLLSRPQSIANHGQCDGGGASNSSVAVYKQGRVSVVAREEKRTLDNLGRWSDDLWQGLLNVIEHEDGLVGRGDARKADLITSPLILIFNCDHGTETTLDLRRSSPPRDLDVAVVQWNRSHAAQV